MYLQERDKKLLSLLSKYGILSTEQVTKLCFDKIAHTTVMRRLRKLEKENLILRQSGLPTGMFAWVLTIDGAKRIGTGEPCRYSNRNTIHHEVILSDLRLTLESVGLGDNWTSETEMRRLRVWDRHQGNDSLVIPDGLFIALQNEQPLAIAVELELQPKNHMRYQKLFRQYKNKNSIACIWYIVKDRAIKNTVISQWNNIHARGATPDLFVSIFSELKENPFEVDLFQPDGNLRRLCSTFKSHPVLTPENENQNNPVQEVSKFEEKSVSKALAC